MSGVALLAGYVADLALGDPRRWHPVAGYGRLALAVEGRLYAPSRVRGTVFVAALVALPAVAAQAAARLARQGVGMLTRAFAHGLLATLTWAALGGRSLIAEARGIGARLEEGDLAGARAALPALAGRDPDQLDTAGVSRAVVESLAENTSDAVIGALLWGAIAGPAGVVAYRTANTLDAMIGHRDERYLEFGWAAARLDDMLSWPAARAGAVLTTACAPLVGGSPSGAWRTLRRDGAAHPSPNAGRMEAAFAGALGVRLGGPLSYRGLAQRRPRLGDGRSPVTTDIARAARLSLAVGAGAALACASARAGLERALPLRGRSERAR